MFETILCSLRLSFWGVIQSTCSKYVDHVNFYNIIDVVLLIQQRLIFFVEMSTFALGWAEFSEIGVVFC